MAPGRLSLDDRLQLADLISRYALACDQRDVPAVVACFAPDGVFEYQDGESQVKGTKALIEFYRSTLTAPGLASDGSTHLMGNVLVEAEGDGARGKIGAIAFHVYAGDQAGDSDGRTMVRGLHYTDSYTRGGDGWLIAHRHHRVTWQSDLAGRVRTPPAD